MAGMTDSTLSNEAAAEDSMDPFGGGSHVISWPRAVTVGQLTDEIAQALGNEVSIAVAMPTDANGADREVSGQHPLKIFVTPPSTDLAAVKQLLAAHRPDPHYGMSDEDIKRGSLERKIRSGEELTMAEVQAALRMLIR
ncbi:hypothetical protein E6R60_26885 [Streptomyces sp. A0642]|uniref:hypothetical protein n=1 Tax=Streptomyces sp. A0642 TaxID=2563100 RepID=UPI0010A29D7E|nr:hypothetical protein [Streptomyces sp. A0642]THA72557.1 hypothetical protein E6R60_26885 [Streptomyces sp. A0642]